MVIQCWWDSFNVLYYPAPSWPNAVNSHLVSVTGFCIFMSWGIITSDSLSWQQWIKSQPCALLLGNVSHCCLGHFSCSFQLSTRAWCLNLSGAMKLLQFLLLWQFYIIEIILHRSCIFPTTRKQTSTRLMVLGAFLTAKWNKSIINSQQAQKVKCSKVPHLVEKVCGI